MNTKFFKVYGASERRDGKVVISPKKCAIFYGYGKDSEKARVGYNWRKDYDHIPKVEEIKADIISLINSQTDKKILTGFTWNDTPIYLSTENQINFKAAYDLAIQTDGANLPVKFKIGEDRKGSAIYYTFDNKEVLAAFISSVFKFINNTLQEGWNEKDSVDYSLFT